MGECGEAEEGPCVLMWLEKGCPGVCREVLVKPESPMDAGAAGMDDALWKSLVAEPPEFLDQMQILKQQNAERAGGLEILIAASRHAAVQGHDRKAVAHSLNREGDQRTGCKRSGDLSDKHWLFQSLQM